MLCRLFGKYKPGRAGLSIANTGPGGPGSLFEYEIFLEKVLTAGTAVL